MFAGEHAIDRVESQAENEKGWQPKPGFAAEGEIEDDGEDAGENRDLIGAYTP